MFKPTAEIQIDQVKKMFSFLQGGNSNPARIFEMVERGQIQELESEKENVKKMINTTNDKGVTLLHQACHHGHVKIVELLLGINGIDVNKKVGSLNQLLELGRM